jgi:hypothetical protein
MQQTFSLLKGLKIALDNHYQRIIAEGDSQIIIHLITRILHGERPTDISPSWHLSRLLEDFGAFLCPNLMIIPSHVKRDANKVADCLANEGVNTETEQIHWQAQISDFNDLSKRCQELAHRDLHPPDGVPRRPPEPHGVEPDRALNEVGRLPSPQH